MIMTIRSIGRAESNSDRGATTAWKVVSRIVPALQMIAEHENLEITIEIKSG